MSPQYLDPRHALEALGIDSFGNGGALPWALAAAVACLIVGWMRRRPAVSWGAVFEAEAGAMRRPELSPTVAWLLRALALGCLALVLAEPVAVRPLPPLPGHGLDLVLVVDTSASMRALDAELESRTRTRLDLAKQVVARFGARRMAAGDRVGLVVFGDHAVTYCPLTSDGELLSAALARVRAGLAGESTAVGDALALAVKRVSAVPEPAGRVVILLTDGRSNAGAVPVPVATALARGARVRVHTVGIGVGGEEVAMAARSRGIASGLRFERHDPDLPTLRTIAAATGGSFFEARRARDLRAIYAEIDAAERPARNLPPRTALTPRVEPLMAAAGGLLLAEIALARVLRRRLE